MPTVQPETDLFETRPTARFLSQCQQQAIAANHSKLASITFPIPPMPAWAALKLLETQTCRHIYYDSPQQWAFVGINAAIEFSAAGRDRFTQAQTFIQTWRSHFIYAESMVKAVLAGRFFCSATFFDEPTHTESTPTESADGFSAEAFEPIHLFVPQVQVMTIKEVSTVTFNTLIAAETDLSEVAKRIHQQHKALHGALPDFCASSFGEQTDQAATPWSLVKDVQAFEREVSAVLEPLRNKQLHKVVIADAMDVAAPQKLDMVRSLQTLRKNHSDCTVFSVGNGRGQSFIGASPERLLSINEGQFTTDALAGSAPRGKTPAEDRAIGEALLSSTKERYEHQVVVEFILEQLRSLGLVPQYLSAPRLLQLLNIQHLHTPIAATLSPQTISPLDILAKLHPTPAVAGLPRPKACQLIAQHETFERGLYAAPIGWIDTEGNSEFVVGIRSALIDGNRARLYAGAGIVADSEPAKELAEIKLKLQALLNALP